MSNLFTIGLCFGLSFIQFSRFQVRCWGICYPIIWHGATSISAFPHSDWLISRHWFMHRWRFQSLVLLLSFLLFNFLVAIAIFIFHMLFQSQRDVNSISMCQVYLILAITSLCSQGIIFEPYFSIMFSP